MLEKSPQKFIGQIAITKRCYEKILRWSLATTEINFICAGKKKKITRVVRIRNVSQSPVWYADWNERELRFAKRNLRAENLSIIATGHSHAAKWSLPHPSPVDVRWCERNSIELIAFPRVCAVRAWRIKKTLAQTLQAEVKIRVI